MVIVPVQEYDMKTHHKVYEIQSHLRCNSVLTPDEMTKMSFDVDVNTQGIIDFINDDADVIKYFITNGTDWLDTQNVILTYIKRSVGEFDVDAVIDALNKNWYFDYATKQLFLYFGYTAITAILLTIVVTIAFGLPAFATIMFFITANTLGLCITVMYSQYVRV